MILEELGLDYEPVYFDLTKPGDAHTKFNPNGRLPTLVDHRNNEYKVWYVHILKSYSLLPDTKQVRQGIRCDHHISH